jgi:hypothetical protein
MSQGTSKGVTKDRRCPGLAVGLRGCAVRRTRAGHPSELARRVRAPCAAWRPWSRSQSTARATMTTPARDRPAIKSSSSPGPRAPSRSARARPTRRPPSSRSTGARTSCSEERRRSQPRGSPSALWSARRRMRPRPAACRRGCQRPSFARRHANERSIVGSRPCRRVRHRDLIAGLRARARAGL